MKLNYIKISQNTYKFFYEDISADGVKNAYGEFYINLEPANEGAVVGKAHLLRKDPDYAKDLLLGLQEELDPVNYSKIDVRL